MSFSGLVAQPGAELLSCLHLLLQVCGNVCEHIPPQPRIRLADVVATDVVSQLVMSYPIELDMCKYRLQGGQGQ